MTIRKVIEKALSDPAYAQELQSHAKAARASQSRKNSKKYKEASRFLGMAFIVDIKEFEGLMPLTSMGVRDLGQVTIRSAAEVTCTVENVTQLYLEGTVTGVEQTFVTTTTTTTQRW